MPIYLFGTLLYDSMYIYVYLSYMFMCAYVYLFVYIYAFYLWCLFMLAGCLQAYRPLPRQEHAAVLPVNFCGYQASV